MVWGYNLPESDIGASQNAVNLYFKNGHLIFVAAVPYVRLRSGRLTDRA